MKLDLAMQELAKELEIEDSFATEVPGVFAIPLDEELILIVSSLPRDGISLKCTLTKIPKKGGEEYVTALLRANLFGEGTDGAILGFDENGEYLTLCQEIDYDIDFPAFRNLIEDFMNSIDFWREETETYR